MWAVNVSRQGAEARDQSQAALDAHLLPFLFCAVIMA